MAIAGATTEPGRRTGYHARAVRRPQRQAASCATSSTQSFESVTSRAAYTMGPELTPVRGGVRRVLRRSHALGVSTGTDAVQLALQAAGVRPGRRGHRPGQHLHRHRRGREPLRRHAGLRRLPAETRPSSTRQPSGRAVTPRTTAIVPGAPLRAAGRHGRHPRGRRGARPGRGRRRLPGARRPLQGPARAARWASPPPSASTRARTSARWATAAPSPPATPAPPRGAPAAQPRPGRQVHARRWSATATACTTCRPALLLVKLPHLAAWNEARRAAAARLRSALGGVHGVTVTRGRATTSSPCTTSTSCRWRTGTRCARGWESGASRSGIHYPVPLHLQPAYAGLGYARGDFPVAERLAERILSLPMFPEIDQAQRDHVVAALEQALA